MENSKKDKILPKEPPIPPKKLNQTSIKTNKSSGVQKVNKTQLENDQTRDKSAEDGFRGLAFFLELFLTPITFGLTSGIGPLMVGATKLSIITGLVAFFSGWVALYFTRGISLYATLPLFIIKWIFDLVITLFYRFNQEDDE